MITIDISKCSGCRMCENVCSFFHQGSTNRNTARIRVTNLYKIGIDGPGVCQQCKERFCMACPSNALQLGKNGEMVVSPTNCSLCGLCVKNCPIGAIEIFKGIVYVCDLCGGSPKCVEVCNRGAIGFDQKIIQEVSLTEEKRKVTNKNPSEKRYEYLLKAGKKLRKKWRKEGA